MNLNNIKTLEPNKEQFDDKRQCRECGIMAYDIIGDFCDMCTDGLEETYTEDGIF